MKFHNTWRGKRGGRRNPEGPVSIFATYGPGSAGQHPVLDCALDVVERAKRELPVPFVNGRVSQLGGPSRASASLSISLDPRESWPHGIFENSRSAKFMVDCEEHKVKQLTGNGVPRFRQASFKTAADAVAKIAKWAAEAAGSRGNPRGYGNLVPEERAFGGQTFRHERTLDTKREAEEYAETLRVAGLKARVVKSGWGGGSYDVYSSRAAFRGKSPRERLGYDPYRNNPIEPLEPGRFKIHFNPAKDWGVDDSVVRSLGKVYLTYQGRRVAVASKGGTMHGVQLIDWTPLGGFQIWKRDGSPKFPHALAYKVKRLLGVE